MTLERRPTARVGSSDDFPVGHERFTEAETTHRYRLQGEAIEILHHPEVFPPSAFGLQLAERLDFGQCRRAIDIGTGTGLLAILAARKGVAEVKATDISHRAVDLANHNARLINGLEQVEARQGEFFADWNGAFDVIVANLPQEILPPAYTAALSQQQRSAIDGGGDGGNGILLDFLDRAPGYMGPHTRLYMFVDTLTDYRSTLSAIDRNYRPRLLWEGLTATKDFVRDNADFFGKLNDAGIVSIIQDYHGKWRAKQMIFELRSR